MTLTDLEIAAGVYADARNKLANLVSTMQAELDAVRRKHIDALRRQVRDVASLHAALAIDIQESAALFEQPRTRVLNGIKVGFQKQRGKVECDDESAVIERIRKLLPAEQSELMIRVTERLHKPAVYDLTAADLKRLGIRIADDEDQVVIKPTDTEVDKLVEALLKDAETLEDAA